MIPLVVQLTVNTSVQQYALTVNENLSTLELKNDTVINVTTSGVPIYEGDYTVTPLANGETVLATTGKMCESDITVLQIPTSTTHNDYGLTFYIAEEV